MIPILFESDATTYSSNGIGQLHETIDYLVTEVRNGEFELELEYPVEGLWFLELTDSRLILAKPNEIDEEHAFRIYEIVKGLSEQTVTVYASTKTNDLGGNLVKRVVVADETPQQAMTKMKADLVDPTDYNFVSDIQTTSSTEWVRKNPLSCISGSDGSLTQYWGGEVKRTNDTIYLYSRRGRDNVTTIRQGKNLEGFTMTTSTKGLITGILPFFTYVDDDGAQITVEGDIVYSPLVNNYPTKHIVPIDYSNDDTVVDLLTLNSAATFYFSYTNPDCDKPKVKLDIDLMQLSDSSEYTKFKDLEKIGLCDTVTVWVEQFDIDVLVKINELTYSGSREQVTRISAGTPSVTFYNDVTNRYMQEISELRKYTEGMEYGVRNLIQLTADSKNTIFRGYTEPPDEISKLDDLWYKDLGSGNIAMLQYDGTSWIDLKVTDAVFADEMSVTKFTAGTLNASLVNLINMNASNITTGTLTGPNFWLNLLTSVMRFIDPETSATLDLDQAKIVFNAGTNYERIISWTGEGAKISPGPNNTGTNGNTSWILEGGDGAHRYIDGVNTTYNDREHRQRMTFINDVIRFHSWAGVEVRDNAYYDGRDVFNYIRAKAFLMGGSALWGMYEDSNLWTIINGQSGVGLQVDGTTILGAYAGGIAVHADFYMNGHVLWDESDTTLKTNVIPSNVDAIAETKRQKVIEFEWDKSNPHNEGKPKGKQFGLSAQDAGMLQIPAEETGEGYMGVNLIKEIHLATLANQQMITRIEGLEARITELEK